MTPSDDACEPSDRIPSESEATAADGRELQMSPSESLDKIRWAVSGLFDLQRYPPAGITDRETTTLEYIAPLADALRCIRPLIKGNTEWPTRTRRALRELVRWLDAVTDRWGWREVVRSAAAREAHLKRCQARFRETQEALERLMLEGAVSASKNWDRAGSCPFDDLADDGRRRFRLTATKSREDGERQFHSARNRLHEMTRIGGCVPGFTEQEYGSLVGIWVGIKPSLLQIEPPTDPPPPVGLDHPSDRPEAAADQAARQPEWEPAAAVVPTEEPPLERALNILKGTSRAKNLVKFLDEQTARKATLWSVTRRLYSKGREPTTSQRASAQQLIRRTAGALSGRNSPLLIEWDWDRDEISLVEAGAKSGPAMRSSKDVADVAK